MTVRTEEELMEMKPCPFCGYKFTGTFRDGLSGGYGVNCEGEGCWLIIRPHYKTVKEAKEAWNRRDEE